MSNSLLKSICIAAALTAPGLLSTLSIASAADERDRFFEQQIRPLLARKCFSCHGAKKQESGLRLDNRAAVLQGGDNGPAVVVRKPEDSLLVEAVNRTSDLKMPPDEALPEKEVRLLEQWVRDGLHWPAEQSRGKASRRDPSTHFAFQEMRRPALPAIADRSRIQTPVDFFVQARLERAGLNAATRAERNVLIRRLTFQLTGLPPNPEEVDAFVSDNSAGAFERHVERLLASPRYGERWGRHWLDVARYADNKGYVFFVENNYPWAWAYRDYVVRAFNEKLPYDRFLVEQLAADQLVTDEDPSSLAAMGFLTVGARFMNNTHDILDDRIDVVTRGLMGFTVTCARCHDHKFDPIPQADYYALYGVFRSSIEPLVPPLFTRPEPTKQYTEFEQGLNERLGKLNAFVDLKRNEISTGARDRIGEYLHAVHRKKLHPNTENFMLLIPKGDLIPSMIHRYEVFLKQARRRNDPVWTLWQAFSDLPEEGFAEAARAVYQKLTQADISGEPRVNGRIAAAFAESPPQSMKDVADRYAAVFKAVNDEWKKRTEAVTKELPPPLDEDTQALVDVLYGFGAPAVLPTELTWGFLDLIPDRTNQAEFKKLQKEVEKWMTTGPGAPPRSMALLDAKQPYDPVVFQRGNPNREGERVQRRFLTQLSGGEPESFKTGSGRLELARRVANSENPLTARVFVNRVWQHHFGTGLVTTPGDFGVRSDLPSHPELLDWLAVEFVESDWSIPHLHRLILNSSAWQQSSMPSTKTAAQAATIDPENRLLWKFPRQRLDFEAMRDSLLAVSGSLDQQLGGPAVNVLGGFNARRSIYGFINRMDVAPVLRAFDFPEPAATSAQRETTTVAPQALYFLNNSFIETCALRFRDRTALRGVEQFDERITQVYLTLFGRRPTNDEHALARRWFNQEPQSGTQSAWLYGYGAIDEKARRVRSFTELTYWTGKRWQVGPRLPDPALGWVFVDQLGGHPSDTMERCVIRRWTAPRDMTVLITGKLRHVPEPGNGVRARIISSREGLLGTWKADQSEVETNSNPSEVRKGDTIDFVVDFNGNLTHDEHEWPVVIQVFDEPTNSTSNTDRIKWDSQKEFRKGRVDPWTSYIHALLMTNEFVFVD